jgi:hypothetical protein
MQRQPSERLAINEKIACHRSPCQRTCATLLHITSDLTLRLLCGAPHKSRLCRGYFRLAPSLGDSPSLCPAVMS